MEDLKYMERAIELAKCSYAHKLLPVGAVAVRGGAIIAEGHKDGSLAAHDDHAEFHLIDNFVASGNGKSLEGCTVYSTLEPCFGCFGRLMNYKVSRIVYGIPDNHGGGVCLLDPKIFPNRHKRDFPGVTGGVKEAEINALFHAFFESGVSEYWKPGNPLVDAVYERNRHLCQKVGH